MPRVLIFGHKPKDFFSKSSKEKFDVVISKNYLEAKKHVSYESFVMVIIDLEDNEKSGMNLASFIRSSPHQRSTPIVFVAKDHKKEWQAFHDYHCYDYFIKPLSSQDVVKIMCLCFFRIDDENSNDVIVFQIGTERYPVRTDDILYIDRMARKTVVHTCTHNFSVPSLSLSDFLSEHTDAFIRIHRGTIVNKNQIRCVNPPASIVIMKHTNEELTIGRSFLGDIRNLFD